MPFALREYARLFRRCSLLAICVFVAACGAGMRSSNGTAPTAAPAAVYSTAARSGGVSTAPPAQRALALIQAELAARGDHAEPDGVLATTASEVLRVIYSTNATANPTGVEAVARRFGFAGIVLGFAAVSVETPEARRFLHDLFASVPNNRRVTRYGVVAGRDNDVGVVLGAVEVTLGDFPRQTQPGDSLHLSGEVDSTYERASVFATSPDGSVRELAMPSRQIKAMLELSSPGVYKLEIMGYGQSGPVVLVNVPVSAGEPEPDGTLEAPVGAVDPTLTREAAEARLAELLNETRRKAKLAPLALDNDLRVIAFSHSLDMSESNFFGHVSPTTGSFEERARRAGLRGSKFGECLALEVTPEGAHAGLLQSPAHRATMLDPSFTHVGIGVSFREWPLGRRALVATLFFGRFPPETAARLSPEQVLAVLQGYRKARELSPLVLDPVLSASAQAGTKALESSSFPSRERSVQAAQAELRRQVNRSRRGRVVCFSVVDIIESAQLATQPSPLSPLAVRVGIGVFPFHDEKGARLLVLLALEGDAGKPIECR